MKSSPYRDMRVMLFFDLPTKNEKDKKEYRNFRHFLLSNGYIMIQFSVYSRFCRNHADVMKHIARVKKNKPLKGEVRLMIVTEKQYLSTLLLNGEMNYYEKTISSDPIIEV